VALSSKKKKPMNIYSVSIYAIGGPIRPIAIPSTMHQEFLNMGKIETISCKKPENFPEMEKNTKNRNQSPITSLLKLDKLE
jgi:hypothetical protein